MKEADINLIESKKLLETCLHAFNDIPNKRLNFGGVKNTYELAARIELFLKERCG